MPKYREYVWPRGLRIADDICPVISLPTTRIDTYKLFQEQGHVAKATFYEFRGRWE